MQHDEDDSIFDYALKDIGDDAVNLLKGSTDEQKVELQTPTSTGH